MSLTIKIIAGRINTKKHCHINYMSATGLLYNKTW